MRRTTGINRRLWLGLACLGAFAEPYALIAGTVFRESGHAFAGVEITLIPSQPGKKNRKQTLRANHRGEFAFRVPAAANEYELVIAAPGYRRESKRVKIEGDERVDENFILEPARKDQ